MSTPKKPDEQDQLYANNRNAKNPKHYFNSRLVRRPHPPALNK
jgi:hypothetical protein